MAKKVINTDGSTNWFGDKQSLNWIQRTINNIGNSFNSALAKYTGSELTSADREANAFNASEAEKAREHDIFMATHKYEFENQSMEAAGVNPALVYGGGNLVQTHATGAAASSVAPSNAGIGDLAQMFMSIARLPQELKNLKAQYDLSKSEKDLNEANARKAAVDAENLQEQTRGAKISNDFMEQTFELRKEAYSLANDLSRADKEKIYAQKDEALANAAKAREGAKTEQSQQVLNQATTCLRYMEAYDIQIMQPYKIMQAKAQTAAENAYATLLGTQEAIQRGIYTEDYIKSIHETAEFNALSAEAKAKVNELLAKVRTGKTIEPVELGDSAVAGFFESIINGAGVMSLNNGLAVMSNLLTIMPAVDAGMAAGLNTSSPNKIGFTQ